MRTRTLEHIFKHTLLFIAILLPLIIAFSALYAPTADTSYEAITNDVDGDFVVFVSQNNYRSYQFMLNLQVFFDNLGLRPFYYSGWDWENNYPILNYEGYNPVTQGVFQVMSYLMGEQNQLDVFDGVFWLDFNNTNNDIPSRSVPAVPWGSAYILCEYLGYIFFVYVFYFLIELFLFVPRLGTELGDKLIHSGHSKGGDVEW